MCAVNDAIRQKYDEQIQQLSLEYDNELNKSKDIRKAIREVVQLVDCAQCVIDNISRCDFGGDKILSSIETSQQGYNERKDFYDDYLIKCENAMKQILDEKKEIFDLRYSVPENCGVCSECCPTYKNKVVGYTK